MAIGGEPTGQDCRARDYFLLERGLRDDGFLHSGIASHIDSNPCLAHVCHETVVKLSFEDNCVAGVPESGDVVAFQLSSSGALWGSVLPEMIFTFHDLSRPTIVEFVVFVIFVFTTGEHATRK